MPDQVTAGPIVADLSQDVTSAVAQIVTQFGADRARLMDIVEAVQRRFGHIGDAAVQAIATELGLHRVEIVDVLSFYAFLDRAPRGHIRIRLSKTPISVIKGARDVARAFETALGVAMGGTTPDGAFTLQWTSDIGMADQEPAAMIDGVVLTELTPADVPAIVAALRTGATPPKAGVRPSLMQAGPVLTGPFGTADGTQAAIALSPAAVIEEVTASKLRGRGARDFRPA